ncbi:MAG: DUF3108 domain-containing protein [Candidatus Kapabacteria bacterium]|nr:DUF3108 domain-containing protein [Candidatus Kapabacteria bacterium]
MTKLNLLFAIICISILFFAPNSFSIPENNDKLMQHGEYLEYEVSFMGAKIGLIKLNISNKELINEVLAYKVNAIIKSYDQLPFINLCVKCESLVDPSLSYSQKFVSNTKISDNSWTQQTLNFDYLNQKYKFTKYKDKKIEFDYNANTQKKWNDGFSLFYLSRKYLNYKKTIKVPTIIDKDTCFTTINFLGKKETVKIENINYPIRTVYFNGLADWEGLYGLKGNFEGWFSDDESAVPILAKMNVYVGKVNIELKKWNRSGWIPPR